MLDDERCVNGCIVEVRLTPEEVRDLDAWIAAQTSLAPVRADAIKSLMKAAIEGRAMASRKGPPDEGLRPDQLTCENDG
jgi:hypothetical protein